MRESDFDSWATRSDDSQRFCAGCGRNAEQVDLTDSDTCPACDEEAGARRTFAPGPALERAIRDHRDLYPRGAGRGR